MKKKVDELKRWIENNFFCSGGGRLNAKMCREEWFERHCRIDKLKELKSLTSFLASDVKISQRFFHILNHKLEQVECGRKECEESPTFQSLSMGYEDFCSIECAQQSEVTKKKIKDTFREKYGVEHHLQKEEFLEKQKETVREKYGVDNVSQAEEIKQKKKETCRDNYGVDFPTRSSVVRQKTIETNLQKYGVKNPMQNEKVKERSRNRRTKKEIKRILQSDRFKGRVKPLFDVDEYDGVKGEYKFLCLKCEETFTDNLRKGKVPRCYNCYPSQKTSEAEKEVYYFLNDLLDCEVKNNEYEIISDQELDIYIPEKNLAVEYDGLYYHGELNGNCDKSYHLNKTEKCEEKDIQLIHIFEDEWLYKQDIVKNQLKYILGEIDDTIYARNCEIKEINPSRKNSFLKKYHLQGEDKSKIKLGAFFENDLVSVMTFSNKRVALGNKNSSSSEYEISRFCTADKNVVGIAGKFLNYFKENYDPEEIITYSDRRWSSHPAVYDKLGFKLKKKTEPNYWYIKNERRMHRFTYRKDVLEDKLDEFDPDLTEWENMQMSGYDRIWDCGNLKYVWN